MTPRVVPGVAGVPDLDVRPPDKRALAIEHCAAQIEAALEARLTVHQRIGLERALDELVDEIAWHRRDPWD